MVAKPGHPHDDISIELVKKIKIDSAFIGSCTNGRMEDLKIAADILKNRKVAPGVVLKIVPATDEIWQQALKDGLIKNLKMPGQWFLMPVAPVVLPVRLVRMVLKKLLSVLATETLQASRVGDMFILPPRR